MKQTLQPFTAATLGVKESMKFDVLERGSINIEFRPKKVLSRPATNRKLVLFRASIKWPKICSMAPVAGYIIVHSPWPTARRWLREHKRKNTHFYEKRTKIWRRETRKSFGLRASGWRKRPGRFTFFTKSFEKSVFRTTFKFFHLEKLVYFYFGQFFLPKHRRFVKILIFSQYFSNSIFCKKSKFWSKIQIFAKNRNFCQKKTIFFKKKFRSKSKFFTFVPDVPILSRKTTRILCIKII